MRINLPVTASEFTFDERDTLVSVTDTSGHITYCNHAFIHVSGYAREELLGQPHNMIRHPDMPAEAFRDMWETIASGRPWTGLVKNRRKNGDFYWVQANVTPMREGDRITGFLSVRTQPMREQVHAAAKGRLRGAHFGTYDFTASVGIAANEQRMQHPACDDAKAHMQRAFAGTGVWLSDGATTVMPVPVHRGAELSSAQREENEQAVHAAWKQSVSDTRHALAGGFYQGWDLHPAQLVSRYAAVYAFFLENLAESTQRLRHFVDKLGQATLSGTTFDDAATGQGLLNFFLRGQACGALTDADVAATGLTTQELATKSFALIAKNRRA